MANNKKHNGIRYFMALLVMSLMVTIPAIYAEETGRKAMSVQNKQVAGICGYTNDLNVKSSLVLSIITLCLPGILEKAKQWKDLKCEAAVCYYDAVSAQLDPTFCIEQEGYSICKYIVGEMFAIPPMSVVEYFRNIVAQYIANPVGLVFGAGAMLARKYSQTCIDGTTCLVASSVLVVVDVAASVQRLIDMVKQIMSLFEDGADACSRIPDIEKDVNEILGIAEEEDDGGWF